MRWRFLSGALALAACATAPASGSAQRGLSTEEQRTLFQAMLSQVTKGGPNHLHMRRLFHLAPHFASAEGADVAVVQAAALLHDATKERGDGEGKERFCTHAEQGAALAKSVASGLGRGDTFSERVGQAVREHMGPCGENPDFHAPRFMTKFCARPYPAPASAEARVLYDIDMLDLMTVEGVRKVVELRQRGSEFGQESIRDSALSGPDSAWKSVTDAQQTLTTKSAQRCGSALVAHTRAFLDGVKWEDVTTLDAFRAAVSAHLETSPLPACLPSVPLCTDASEGCPGS